jgi:hypothetical protein
MKNIALTAAIIALSATSAFAYQVTGPVTELTDGKIVVTKGKEKFEITRDAKTKIPAEVKVGSKVTVEYTMTATEVTDKSTKK